MNYIKTPDLCDRCKYSLWECAQTAGLLENLCRGCKQLEGRCCRCVKVRLNTPCPYFAEKTDEQTEIAQLNAEIERLKAENRTLRNELCLKCGKYREAHRGACDGCRWRGRHQKCSCCRRNRSMRDLWEEAPNE